MDIKIRTATVEDAEKLLEIYAYYIKNTAVTFEYEVPSVEEFRERISHILEHYLESYNLSIQDFALQAEISNIAALSLLCCRK